MPYGHEEEISMNKDTIENIDARQVQLKIKLIMGGAAGRAIRKPGESCAVSADPLPSLCLGPPNDDNMLLEQN